MPTSPFIARTRYEWLVPHEEPDPDSAQEHSDIEERLFSLPQGHGQASYLSLNLPLNMVFRRVSCRFSAKAQGQIIPLAEVREQFSEPALTIHCTSSGQLLHENLFMQREHLYGSEQCFFEHGKEFHYIPKLHASEQIDLSMVIIGDSALEQLLSAEYSALLLQSLQLDAGRVCSMMPIAYAIRRLLYESLNTGLQGQMLKLSIQSRLVEFLFALIQSLVKPEAVKVERVGKKVVEEIRDELLHLEGKIPTLQSLSLKYGLEVRELQQAFKREYNQTLVGFIMDQRLMLAHQEIKESDTPLKAISYRLGYSHVNHFITAFRKLFGYPPGKLRSGR